MLTILAARNKGGVFSPSISKESRGEIDIIYAKNKKSLKKLKKRGFDKVMIAPSALEMAGALAVQYTAEPDYAISALPRVLGSMAALPVGELYLSMNGERAAEIIDICSDCARLFTVISRQGGGEEAFDRLYFNKGIIMRRISAPNSRVGATALCVTEDGRVPPGVMSLDLRRLNRVKFLGGELDFLETEFGVSPTAELYSFAGLSLPEKGEIRADYGDKILYLDTAEVL
ncbi:MAG: hypothetical protein ACI4SS_02570 [Clostridia bacterium]